MLVRGLFRPHSLTLLAGVAAGAVAAGQFEIWLGGGPWTFDVAVVGACAGAALVDIAILCSQIAPITYGSARFRPGE